MQRAPPSHVRRPKPYDRPTAPSLKASTRGSFYKAQNFTIREATFNDTQYHFDTFMDKLAEKIIPGATFDSSERDPPPRCHPGTRLAIVERTLHFFADRESNKRLLWLVGPAGVGKSAIMQTLAETSSTPDFTLGASLFFSVNGRDNGLKTIATLAYQLAVKSELYKDFIQRELTKDPTLLEKALVSQFKKFIVEPFVLQGISPDDHERFLILIDGLDECDSQDTQRTVLDLISSFCIEHPASPLIWVIASRPEPHITRFLSQPNVRFSYMAERLEVDNDESRHDVERYLRNGLENIRTKYEALDSFPHWPAEHDFLKLATAAGGLFAFGKAVVDYIDDPMYANPASQLEEVLEVIDEIRSRKGEGRRHPMAELDVLYSRIVSKIPRGVLNDTKRLLLCMISPPPLPARVDTPDFLFCCNWLGIPPAAAYGALHHLHSVLDIPSVPDAPLKSSQFRHKSFRDHLVSVERSGMFLNVDAEAHDLKTQCATRIFEGVSKALENGRSPHDGIFLSWSSRIEERKKHKENQYYAALRFTAKTLTHRYLRYGPSVLFALKLIDIRFSNHVRFDWVEFSKLVSVIFGKDARPDLEKSNAFQQMSICMLKMDKIPDWMSIIVSCSSQYRDAAPTQRECSVGYSHKAMEWLNDPDNKGYWVYLVGGGCSCVGDILRKLGDRKTGTSVSRIIG